MEKSPSNSEAKNQPTGWENMSERQDQTLEPILDVDNARTEVQEVEGTPEDYENFAKQNFVHLLDALSDPNVNVDDVAEQEINAQIAITANIISSLDNDESDLGQIQSKDIFGSFNDIYQTKYQESAARGQTHMAELNQRLIDANHIVKNQFDEYILDQRPAQPGDLPGNVIE